MKKNNFFFILLFFMGFVLGQEERKKVGLVLSGGGAKGYAHIGALKVIEHQGIKIDYIAGTSIGAIIGGLYASGYSAQQIEELIERIDFSKFMTPGKQRSYKGLYDKTYNEKYFVELELNKKFAPQLPSGIVNNQAPLELLSQFFKPVHDITDFSQLKIPFICVATNAETGGEKIFESGYLPEVITASSAFPSLIEPVEIDGSLYIDGGLVNNFPVDLLKDKVDIIIGVDVSSGLYSKEELNSVPLLIEQITSYQMVKKTKESRDLVDILIRPNIAGFGVTDFDQNKTLIALGETAALLQLDKLKALSTDYANPGIKLSGKENYILISDLKTSGLKNYTNQYIKGKLNLDLPAVVYYPDLIKDIEKLYSSGDFKKIKHKIVHQDAPKNTLELEIEENELKNRIKLGAHFDNLLGFGLLGNITTKPKNFKNSSVSLDAVIGSNPRYYFNFYKDNGFLPSFGFNSNYISYDYNFRGSELDNIKDLSYRNSVLTNQLFFQNIVFTKIAVGVGMEHQYIRSSTETLVDGHPLKNPYRDHFYNPYSFLKVDNLDHAYFPKSGTSTEIVAKHYLASSIEDSRSVSSVRASQKIAFPISPKLSAHIWGDLGISIGTEPLYHVYKFHLGGTNQQEIQNTKPFLGLPFAYANGNYMLNVGSTLQYSVAEKHYLKASFNMASLNDYIEQVKLGDIDFEGYGLGYGYDSPLGPLEVIFSYSPQYKSVVSYVNLGYWF
ncbi:MAG: patatin [Flavobacteriaceae bacterium]|nr:MAG: patatin [Flavobacteriaceae bacterium]